MKYLKPILPLTLFIFILLSPAKAQDIQDDALVSKKGTPILPTSSQFAVGFDASPIFTYIGNLMNLDNYNTLVFGLVNSNFYGKYLISPTTAVRVKFKASANSGLLTNLIPSDLSPEDKVEDRFDYSQTSFFLAPGFEWRMGKGRLQVSYGGEAIMSYTNSSQSYDYGNSITEFNPTPLTTTNFYSKSYSSRSNRQTENTNGSSLSFGLRGFVGFEYFFMPKISIGTELGLQHVQTWSNGSKYVSEYWNYIEDLVEEEVIEGGKSRTGNFSSDYLNGQLVLLIYF